MQFKIHSQVAARFKLIAHKGDGIPLRQTDWFDNIVLDTGLARMAVGTWIDRCCVGSGNTTPVVSQTALTSFIASTLTIQAESSTIQTTTAPYYRAYIMTWRFGMGAATGNISEVGLGWGNANLWNRALVKDISGNPTTITVLSDEYLDVVSEVREYPQQSLSGSFNLLDKTGAVISNHTYIGYPVMRNVIRRFGKLSLASSTANNSYATFVHSNTITSNLTTTDVAGSLDIIGSNNPTYSGNSLQQVFVIDIARANFAHRSFFIQHGDGGLMAGQNASGYKLQISPTITKTASQEMTYTFEMSWGRYTP